MAALPESAAPNIPGILSWIIEAARLLKTILIGQLDNTFEGTLRASQTTSTFTDGRIKIGSAVLAIPMTSNAAGAVSGLYISAIENGEVEFTHANTAAADKTFRFVIVGAGIPPERTAT